MIFYMYKINFKNTIILFYIVFMILSIINRATTVPIKVTKNMQKKKNSSNIYK